MFVSSCNSCIFTFKENINLIWKIRVLIEMDFDSIEFWHECMMSNSYWHQWSTLDLVSCILICFHTRPPNWVKTGRKDRKQTALAYRQVCNFVICCCVFVSMSWFIVNVLRLTIDSRKSSRKKTNMCSYIWYVFQRLKPRFCLFHILFP